MIYFDDKIIKIEMIEIGILRVFYEWIVFDSKQGCQLPFID